MSSAGTSLPPAALGRLVRLSRVMEIVTGIGIGLVAILTVVALLIPDWTRNIALAKLGQAGAVLPITPLGRAVAGIVLAIPVGVMIYGLLAAAHGCERCPLQGDQGGGGYECAGRCCFSDPGMHVVSDGSVLSIQPEPYRGRVPIIVNLDVMLARRKMRSKELAERIGITEQNLSLLKSGKVKGVRFETLARICAVLECQPGDVLEYRSDTTDPAGEQDI